MNRLLAFICGLMLTSSAFAQYGSGTGGYGSVAVTAQTIAAAGGVTNGSVSSFSSLTTTLNASGQIGNGIGGSGSAIDWFGGIRTQPSSGGQYDFLTPGGVNALDIYGATQTIPLSFNRNLGNIWEFPLWADPVNKQNSGFQAVAIGIYGRHGGYGSTLEGLPGDSKGITPAMPLPPLIIDAYTGEGNNTNELAITNLLTLAANSGLIAAYTNGGGQVWLHLDDNTKYWNANRDANGYLSINTNNFPDGTNFANVVHSYGVKLMVTEYWYPYPTNQVNVNFSGITAGYPAMPAMTPNKVHVDISKMYDCGLDGLRLSDTGAGSGPSGPYFDSVRSVNENILNPYTFGGVSAMFPYGYVNGSFGKARTTPLALEILTLSLGDTPNEIQGSANIIDHDTGTFNGYISSTTNIIAWMSRWRATMQYEIPLRGTGHYGEAMNQFTEQSGDMSVNDTRTCLTFNALGDAKTYFTLTSTNSSLASRLPNFLANATNAAMISVQVDPLCSIPFKVYDNGATNISVWCKPLVGGSVAVGLVNETAVSSNITFTLSSLQLDNSKSYAALDIWSNVTFSVGNTITYTNAPAQSVAFLKIFPASLTNYSPWTWTPVAGQVIIRNSNNWAYAITTSSTNAAYKINP